MATNRKQKPNPNSARGLRLQAVFSYRIAFIRALAVGFGVPEKCSCMRDAHSRALMAASVEQAPGYEEFQPSGRKGIRRATDPFRALAENAGARLLEGSPWADGTRDYSVGSQVLGLLRASPMSGYFRQCDVYVGIMDGDVRAFQTNLARELEVFCQERKIPVVGHGARAVRSAIRKWLKRVNELDKLW